MKARAAGALFLMAALMAGRCLRKSEDDRRRRAFTPVTTR